VPDADARPPDALAVRGPLDRIARVRERVVAGLPSEQPDVPASGVLEGMIVALAGAAAKGVAAQGCIAAAFEAVGQVLKEEEARAAGAGASALPSADGEDAAGQAGKDADAPDDVDGDAPACQPVTEFTPMLDLAADQLAIDPGRSGRPQEPVDAELLAALIAIEVAAGAPKPAARASAQAALGDRDAALAAIVMPEPPPMSDGELCERVNRLQAWLAALGGSEQPGDEWRDAAE